jgi:hypothetical protein
MNDKQLCYMHLVSRHYCKISIISFIKQSFQRREPPFSISTGHCTFLPLQGFKHILWGLLILSKIALDISWYEKEAYLLSFFLPLIFFMVHVINPNSAFFSANVLRDSWSSIVFSLV